MKKLLLLLMTVLLMAGTAQAQTTTYTGTIRDLSMNPVTAGQVTFTLAPSTDSLTANRRATVGLYEVNIPKLAVVLEVEQDARHVTRLIWLRLIRGM